MVGFNCSCSFNWRMFCLQLIFLVCERRFLIGSFKFEFLWKHPISSFTCWTPYFLKKLNFTSSFSFSWTQSKQYTLLLSPIPPKIQISFPQVSQLKSENSCQISAFYIWNFFPLETSSFRKSTNFLTSMLQINYIEFGVKELLFKLLWELTLFSHN